MTADGDQPGLLLKVVKASGLLLKVVKALS
jgi:hypothetical protein